MTPSWLKVMVTPQLEIWNGKFGVEYTDRSSVDIGARQKAFKKLLKGLPVENVLEVGCGKGDNITALKKLGYEVKGVEPLPYALNKARDSGHEVVQGSCFSIPFPDKEFDLTFTAGVLMHVAPEDKASAVKELWRVTKSYLLVIEYYAPEEKSINYRGNKELLWLRDYSSWGKNLLEKGQLSRSNGFDNCTYWLFKKE